VRDSTSQSSISPTPIYFETKHPSGLPNRTMAATLLRIPRSVVTRDEDPFVLLHVSSTGSGALDLKLIGTDNSTVFTVSCKLTPDRLRLGRPLAIMFMRYFGS